MFGTIYECGWEMNLSPWVAEMRRVAGFTLIEVLAAMAVFAIASLGLAVGVSSVIRANQRSYLSSIATNLAQDKLEELKAMSPGNIASCPSPCENPAHITNNVKFSRTWNVSDDTPVAGVIQIDVTVDWDGHTAHSLTMSSIVKK